MAGLPSFTPILPILIVVWRMRALIRRFQELNAVSPDSSVSLDVLDVRRSGIFRRLVRRGVIGTNGDRYYLDTERYQQWRAARRRRAFVAFAVIAAAFMVAWFSGWL